jgi:hypothetical protein
MDNGQWTMDKDGRYPADPQPHGLAWTEPGSRHLAGSALQAANRWAMSRGLLDK